MKYLRIADYSLNPRGKYKNESNFSGEHLKDLIEKYKNVIVDLNGVTIDFNFLDGAFHNIKVKKIKLYCNTEIENYINNILLKQNII